MADKDKLRLKKMKIKVLIFSSLLLGSFFLNQVRCQTAEEFIDKLKTESPSYHDRSLNTYYLSDLDMDGDYEIIERTNRVESANMGFLNAELNHAFTYDIIYILKENDYSLSETDIGRHLEIQISHYEMWRNNILNPVNLTQDSKQLIEKNRSYFLEEIDFIINRIRGMLK